MMFFAAGVAAGVWAKIVAGTSAAVRRVRILMGKCLIYEFPIGDAKEFARLPCLKPSGRGAGVRAVIYRPQSPRFQAIEASHEIPQERRQRRRHDARPNCASRHVGPDTA